MSDLWAFLADAHTQATLTWLGGGLVVVAGGLWAAVKFFASRGSDGATPTPTPTRVQADRGGIAGGRNISVRTSHGLSGGMAVLLVLAVVGAVLLTGGLLGQRIIAMNSAATGGTITNSTVTINGGAGSTKP